MAVKTASEMTYTVSGGALNSTQTKPSLPRAALTGKHDTLVRRAHQMLNAALGLPKRRPTVMFVVLLYRCTTFKSVMYYIITDGSC